MLGRKSLERLATCDPILQDIVKLCMEKIDNGEGTLVKDITVIQGKRSLKKQKELIAKGFSKLKDPKNSKHVTGDKPSQAVDIAPYPINWDDIEAFKELGQLIKDSAMELGYTFDIEWGGDWKTFKDYPHFELKNK